MVDELYLPVKKEDGLYFTDTGAGSGTGGSDPKIILVRTFKGEISPMAESSINQFYGAILDFVLGNEITTGLRNEDLGKTLAELIKLNEGFDLRDHIAISTAAHNAFYGPHLRIDANIPFGSVRPKLRYQRSSQYRRENVKDLMILTIFAETIFPPKKKILDFVSPDVF